MLRREFDGAAERIEPSSIGCGTLIDSIFLLFFQCSVRGREMFQEPFFLHPPSARPRDGIYINPMTAFIAEATPKPKDSESFYLHSPHDLVYTRITPLFDDSGTRDVVERKDETLTGKWHVPDIPSVGTSAQGDLNLARRPSRSLYFLLDYYIVD